MHGTIILLTVFTVQEYIQKFEEHGYTSQNYIAAMSLEVCVYISYAYHTVYVYINFVVYIV